MKKLKPWQIVLLVIFYPVGIVYLIVWLCRRNKQPAQAVNSDTAKMTVVRDFHTKVVGVTFNNDDGSSRQEIIKNSRSGEDIILKPVPTAEYPNAVGVFNTRGQQLGHIKDDLAADLKQQFPNNPMSVHIASLTGGEDGAAFGCNLHIVIYA